MQIPILQGTIKRRLLVNYRVDPDAIQKILPPPFYPKLHAGFAIAGICLIRLENIRPLGLPTLIGLSSENAAHRIAVRWTDDAGAEQEGVFIPRRDTDSRLNTLIGGRLFPGEHHYAKFTIVDDGSRVEVAMDSKDSKASVRVAGTVTPNFPEKSCFDSLAEASKFFENGYLGFSATRNPLRFDGLLLKTSKWRVQALRITTVSSSFFSETQFPNGTAEFDHALVMREIPHEWHPVEDIRAEMCADPSFACC